MTLRNIPKGGISGMGQARERHHGAGRPLAAPGHGPAWLKTTWPGHGRGPPHPTGPEEAASGGAETLPVSRQGLHTQEAAKPEV